MSKTPFSNICDMLGDLYASHNDSWNEFIDVNDIGMPLAYAMSRSYVYDLTEEGYSAVNETWKGLLEYVGADVDGEYPTWDSIVEASSVLEYPL